MDYFSCLRVSFRCPFGGQTHRWRSPCLFASRDQNDPFFFEPSVCILQGFLVDCFEVRQITLMVQGLAQLLQRSKLECLIKARDGLDGEKDSEVLAKNKLTSCALSRAFFISTQISFGPSCGGVRPIRDTVPSQQASINGQIRKQ